MSKKLRAKKFVIFFEASYDLSHAAIIVDHRCTDIRQIPSEWLRI